MTREKIIPSVLTAVVVLLLLSSLFLVKINFNRKSDLKSEKIKSEKLLTEKLTIENDLGKIRAEFTVLKGKSEATDKLLAEAEKKLTEKEKRISSLSWETNSLRKNKKDLEELRKLKADLDKDYSDLKLNFAKIEAQNKELQSAVPTLEAEKKNLAEKLEQSQLYKADNFQVSASRSAKKEKLTIKATRTKKLIITFEVPSSMTEKISFKLVTPSGKTINADNIALSWNFQDNARTLTASLSPVTGEFEESRNVELTYAPKEKLEKGVYKIQIISNGNNIGNCSIKFK